jgi:hypothetical protein
MEFEFLYFFSLNFHLIHYFNSRDSVITKSHNTFKTFLFDVIYINFFIIKTNFVSTSPYSELSFSVIIKSEKSKVNKFSLFIANEWNVARLREVKSAFLSFLRAVAKKITDLNFRISQKETETSHLKKNQNK